MKIQITFLKQFALFLLLCGFTTTSVPNVSNRQANGSHPSSGVPPSSAGGILPVASTPFSNITDNSALFNVQNPHEEAPNSTVNASEVWYKKPKVQLSGIVLASAIAYFGYGYFFQSGTSSLPKSNQTAAPEILPATEAGTNFDFVILLTGSISFLFVCFLLWFCYFPKSSTPKKEVKKVEKQEKTPPKEGSKKRKAKKSNKIVSKLISKGGFTSRTTQQTATATSKAQNRLASKATIRPSTVTTPTSPSRASTMNFSSAGTSTARTAMASLGTSTTRTVSSPHTSSLERQKAWGFKTHLASGNSPPVVTSSPLGYASRGSPRGVSTVPIGPSSPSLGLTQRISTPEELSMGIETSIDMLPTPTTSPKQSSRATSSAFKKTKTGMKKRKQAVEESTLKIDPETDPEP